MMELDNSPDERSSRVERRERNTKHKATPYAKHKKSRKNEDKKSNDGEDKNLITSAFGKVMGFVSSFMNFTTFTPKEAESSESDEEIEDKKDEPSNEEKQQKKQDEILSKPIGTLFSNQDSIATVIKGQKGITQSDYQFYVQLLKERVQDQPKEEEKVNQSTSANPTSSVLRPIAVHGPNVTSADILRPFVKKTPRQTMNGIQNVSPTATGQLQVGLTKKRPLSPSPTKPSLALQPPSTSSSEKSMLQNGDSQEQETTYLDRQPPFKRRLREGTPLGVSETAKRILEALDQFSSPVTEVKTPNFLHFKDRNLSASRTPVSANVSIGLTPRDKIERTALKSPAITKPLNLSGISDLPPSQSITSAPLTSAKKVVKTPQPPVQTQPPVQKEKVQPPPKREIVEIDQEEIDEEPELTKKSRKITNQPDYQKHRKQAENVDLPRETAQEKSMLEKLSQIPPLPTNLLNFNFEVKPKESEKKEKKEEIEEKVPAVQPKPQVEEKEKPKSAPVFDIPKKDEAPKTAPALPVFPAVTSFAPMKATDTVSKWKPSSEDDSSKKKRKPEETTTKNKFAALAEEEPQEVFAPGADDSDGSGSGSDSDTDDEKKEKPSYVGQSFKFDFSSAPAPPQGFNFGTTASTPVFNLGLPPAPSATSTEAPTFTFGSTSSPIKFTFENKEKEKTPEAPKTSTFVFGTTAVTPAPVAEEKPKPAEPEKVVEEKKEEPKPVNDFKAIFTMPITPVASEKKEEAKPKESAPPSAIFGTSFTPVSDTKTTTSTPFTFGATEKDKPAVTSSFTTITANPVISFGSTAPAPVEKKEEKPATSNSFVFGATETTTPAPSTPSTGFSFGSSTGFTAPAPTTTFGSTGTTFGSTTPTATTTPSIPAFGSTTPSSTSTPAPFGSTATTSSTPFVFGSTGNAPSTTTTTSDFTFGASNNGMESSPMKPSNSGFGSSTPAFGTTNSTPAFGSSTPNAFGSTTAPSTPFGSSTPAFGSSTPAFGSSTPSFGSTGTAPFGDNSSTGFGNSSTGFGAPFGSTSNTPAFGNSTPAFGSTPSFGSSTPAFGSTGTAPFGSTGNSFGGTTFGAPAPSTFPGFGATSAPTPAFNGDFGSTNQPSPFGDQGPGGFTIGASNDRKKVKGKRVFKK